MKEKEQVYETYEETQRVQHEDRRNRQVKKENYVIGLIMLFVKILVGMFLASVLFPNEVGGEIVCVGVLVGWTFFNKIVRFNLYGNTTLVIGFWFFKLIVSCMMGVLAVPIMIVWYVYHIIVQWHRTRQG